MTPYIYPSDIPRPIETPHTEPAQAQCPRTGDMVTISKCTDHNAQIYCEKCGHMHTVLREREGVTLV
jgi:predicted RNA-binding Zn-ribbon protein involved in translation (DUF1610 family)